MNIVFLDGKCLICNGIIKFIYRIDRKKRIKFCHLQDEKALNYLEQDFVKNLSTVVFYQDGKISTKSDAAINIMVTLGHTYFKLFRFIPRFIRDGIYQFIAKNRYIIGEELDVCPIPEADLAERFL
ncbi:MULTISPECIES: thiol-disulfide oxidoreductase DCC family protein [Halobacteriovorax]|uniref:DUF393 domain-containing protein n=1 Tax=Halobacteriovorax vibrionivorans TaxID=2152716 RepID=A0ABY0IJ24_9BACT|nr:MULTISPECIES: DCC1-like thiol-disulfide oxidoreductase family protein [Halobacteriovorax]RZF22475.1 DUF393 domain-containing protein [Halobacteriovorax vibrionivorans]TGD47666.1 DUF393 domain-containing protein [Halobacteriovorax sp. Y22]